MSLAKILSGPAYAGQIAQQADAEAALAQLRTQYLDLRTDAEAARGDGDIAAAEALEIQAEAVNQQIAQANAAIVAVDQALAATLNAATVEIDVPIPVQDVKRYLMVAGRWARISALARGLVSGTDAEKLAAIALADALENLTEFDLAVPAYAQACNDGLDGGVSNGLLTADDKARILALGKKPAPLWQQLLHRELDHGDIKTARAAL